MKVSGLAAIVTGGASGLGGAVVDMLAAAHAKVSIFDIDARRGAEKALQVAGHFVSVDVTDESSVGRAIQSAEDMHGRARILVNCAGVGPPGKVLRRDGTSIPLSDFSKIVNINLVGSFNVLSQFAARVHECDLLGEERAVIINTASVAAFDGQIGQAAYAASKGGLVALTLPLAREFARYGIRVMTIAPGIFLTPLLAALPAEVQESLGRQVPFPARLGRPEEFATLVESVIANPMLNGETIRLDGAIRMAPK